MAIRTFNSVGGFSVGENPETIILPNGDITTDFATFTANVDAGNVRTDHLLYANGQPWDFQLPAGGTNGQLQFYENGDFGASANLSFDKSTNVLKVIGNANVTNTLITGNVRTDNLLHSDGTPWDFQLPAGSTNGQIQYYLDGDFGASTNFVFDPTSNVLTVSGNIAATNYTASGNANITGNVSANNVSISNNATVGGNINATGNVSGNNATFTSNVTVGGKLNISGNLNIGSTDKTIVFTKGSNLYYSSNLQFDYTSNVLTLAGNLFTTNANLGNLAIANYFSGTLDALSNAQPNITSVGTLTNLTVAGNTTTANVYTSNLSVTGKVITSLLPSSTGTYDLGSSTYAWRNVWVDSHVYIGGATGYIGAIGNVIQVDALTAANKIMADKITVSNEALLQGDVTVSGNLTVGGTTTYINVTNMDIKDPLISLGGSGSGANATSYDSKDRGLVLRNYKSDGSGVQNQAFVWSSTGNEFRAFANVTDITGEVVVGDVYANIHANVFKGNVQGVLLTNNQPYINQVGVLDNLEVDGTLTVDTHASIASLEASGMQYPTSDGSQRQVLSTDGAGELYWATIDTYRLANGTSNVQVYGPGPDYPEDEGGNVAISVAGVANIVVVDTTGANVSGNLTVSNTTTTTTLAIDQSKVRAAHINTTSIATATIVTVLTSDFRAVEYFIKGEDSTGHKYSVATISAVHDGSGNVEWSTYGGVHSGASTGTFDVVYDNATDPDNHRVLLKVTPSSSNSTDWTVQYRLI